MKKRSPRFELRMLLFSLLFLFVFALLLRVLVRGNIIQILPENRNTQDSETIIDSKITEKRIEVSYQQQKLYYYENNELLFDSDIVTGNETTAIIPYGTYEVLHMAKDATLTGSDYEKHVDYWIGFDKETNGHLVGFHDASWRTVFGGDEWKSNPTLECVNMPDDTMKKLYEAVSIGTEIYIHD